MQRDLPLGALTLLRRGARHFETGLGGEPLHRLRKGEILGLHGEADHVAMRAAAEAMEEALVLDDVERGRLLLVEGAETRELVALADQPHPAADHRGKREP